MSVHVDIEAQLDNRSIMVSANDIKGGLERIGADAGKGFSSGLSREMSGGLSGIKGAIAEVGRGLRTGIDSELRGMGSSFDAVSSKVAGIGTAGSAAVAGVAAIGAAAAIAGKQLYDLGAQWDEIADGITIRTGKVGEQLKALTDVVGDVGSTTAASLDSIGTIVGQISQSMPDLTQNGNAVRQMASNLAYLDANGQAVNIRELGKAFDAFGVNAADQVQTLDALNNVSQSTGIPINSLIETVRAGAPQFKQFGLDVGSATGLIASFEDAGLDSGVAVTGLRIALKNVGDDARGAGPALADAVTQIKAFHDAGQEGSAREAAQGIFGSKNFAPFLDAIETGKLSVEGLNEALKQTGTSIADLQTATDDGAQGWQKLSNTIKTEVAPVANAFFSYVNTEVQYLTGHLTEATTQLKDFAAVPITADSALGKMLLPAGGLGGTPGVPAPHGLGASLNRTDGLYTPNGLLAPNWGTNPVTGSTAGSGGSSGPKLPTAPVTPYDSSLPAGFAGLPQTSAIVSAESSYMDANTSLAEKKARADQLEKSNVATADEIQKARNDVISAEHTQHEAELRLYDARNSLYTKGAKQIEGLTNQLDAVFAKIDDDFGVSKGLPGIVENLVKTLGNFAMAGAIRSSPELQAAAISLMTPQTGQTGSPSTGYAGYAASALGPAALMPSGYGIPAPGASSGGSYGLPGGTNTGGYGSGGKGIFPDWVQQVGAAFGVTPSTYAGHQETDRHEAGYAPNPGHENRGIDWSGTPQAMQKFADYLKNVPSMEQVIWNGGGIGTGDTVEIAGGRPQPGYFAGDLAGHGNHVHTRQSEPIPLPGMAAAPYDPYASAAPGYTSAVSPTAWGGPLPSLPAGGGGGHGYGPGAPGPGMVGAGIPATPLIGGGGGSVLPTYAPAAASGGGGGGGGGGLLGAAEEAGGMALDVMAPGAGEAAKVGIQLGKRAIQFGAQAAAIGIGGLEETFIPHGSPNADPGKSWFGRIAAGVSGARPAAQNMAAQKAPPPAPVGSPASGQGSGKPPGPQVGVQMNNPTFTGSDHSVANEINRHQGAAYGGW